TGITNVLFHAPLGDEAVATKHLHTQVGRFIANLGQEGFGDRGQEAKQRIGRFTLFFSFATVNHVKLLTSKIDQSTSTLGYCFLGQQHTTDVRMNDDRVSNAFRILRTTQCAHGQSVFSVCQRALEAQFSGSQPLSRGTNSSRVHEGEHAVHAFVLRPDQPTFGAVEVHYAGSVSVDTHLVLQGVTGHGVTLSGRAVFIRQVL